MEWWKGVACLVVVILGIVLFLYGANFYDNTVGWAGVYVFFVGIAAYVLLWVFSRSAKSEVTSALDQKP